jgi:hypothetical protein
MGCEHINFPFKLLEDLGQNMYPQVIVDTRIVINYPSQDENITPEVMSRAWIPSRNA